MLNQAKNIQPLPQVLQGNQPLGLGNLLFRNLQNSQYFSIVPLQQQPITQYQPLQFYCYPTLQFKLNPMFTPIAPLQQQPEKSKISNTKEKYSRSVLIKNCARYLIRNIIKSLNQFEETIQELFNQENPDLKPDDFKFNEFAEYFTKNIDIFTSIQIIRKHWLVCESNPQEENYRNKMFKAFCKYYLKEKSYRYVLGGKMKMKKYYLRTVRQMLKHIDNASTYKSNFY